MACSAGFMSETAVVYDDRDEADSQPTDNLPVPYLPGLAAWRTRNCGQPSRDGGFPSNPHCRLGLCNCCFTPSRTPSFPGSGGDGEEGLLILRGVCRGMRREVSVSSRAVAAADQSEPPAGRTLRVCSARQAASSKTTRCSLEHGR